MKYIAILRGINVGGYRKIIMADLKAMCLKINYKNPITYIQSGNLIFETNKTNIKTIESELAQEILKTFGHQVPVIVRLANDIKNIINHNPFKNSISESKNLYITFLSDIPKEKQQQEFESLSFDKDKFVILGKEIHMNIQAPYHKTKLSNNVIENKLKVTATTRNWKTVNKLLELSE